VWSCGLCGLVWGCWSQFSGPCPGFSSNTRLVSADGTIFVPCLVGLWSGAVAGCCILVVYLFQVCGPSAIELLVVCTGPSGTVVWFQWFWG